jgi:serine/threonine protein kinase/WD40 repeat protein
MNEESLVREAAALPIGERAAFLDAACGADSALRQRVEAALAGGERTEALWGVSASHGGAALEIPCGTLIGPYKILEQIGEGGFGIVYLAEQEQSVRRTVALKIIKPGMDTREVIARFEAERQALALMDHQNIARVLDGGATAAGRPYFVMELVKGIPITAYCNNNRLTPRERLELFVPVCHALQHAHQKGIIHRDIKPSNVLVCLYDGRPVPKVIDFGVAKAIDQRLTAKTMFTRHGQVVGTLEYMSPEQAELSQLDIDTRSDVYSLGVLLYELLTGSTPITKQQLRQAGFSEILRIIRETDPDRPSTRLSRAHDGLASISAQRRTEPAKLGALLKGELDWLVMKALEKDRTRRYESASGLARDIERYLRDEPVEACPPSVGYRLGKLVRRHRRSVVAGGVIAALLVALLFNFSVGYVRLAAARRQATNEAANARRAESDALASLQEARQQEQRARTAESAAKLDRDRALEAEMLAREQRDRAVSAEQEAQRQREREALAREDAMDALARSQFEQARAVRLAGQPGHRWIGLDLLRQAAGLRGRARSAPATGQSIDAVVSPSAPVLPAEAELRSEAVAALLASDGRAARHYPGFAHSVSYGGKFVASFVVDRDLQDAGLTITDLTAGKVVRQWKGQDARLLSGVSLSLSPDAEQLAVLSLNMHDIKLWRLRDLRLLGTLTMPSMEPATKGDDGAKTAPPRPSAGLRMVRQVAFSPDGKYLACVSAPGAAETAVLLWNLAERGSASAIGSARRLPLLSAAFSPDSRRIAFATQSDKVTVWDIAEQRAAAEITLPLPTTDGAIGFHPDGNLLAIHCQDSESRSRLLLWDIAQNREAARVDTGSVVVAAPISFTLDGKRAALVGTTGLLIVCDLPPSPHFAQRQPLRLDHGSLPQLLAWSADGALVTGGLAGLKQWELTRGDALTLLPLEWDQKPGHFGRLAFSPDGQTLVAAPWHGAEVMTFDRLSGKKLRTLASGLKHEPAFDLRYSPDGKQLVRCGLSGVVAWDAQNGNETMRLAPDTIGLSASTSIGFRKDNNLLAAGMQGGRPSVREVATGNTVWAPSSNQAAMAAVSTNGRFALTYRAFALAGDLLVPVWDLEKDQLKFTLRGPEGKGYQTLAQFSPDSRWILAVHYGGDISKSFPPGGPDTGQAGNAQPAAGSLIPSSPVRFTFGASAASIVAPDQEWIGDVWTAETGKQHLKLGGPSTVEYSVFSPDGRYLAISMRNQTIRVWDVNAGRELFDWRPVAGLNRAPFAPRDLAFTADSTSLVVPDPALPVLHTLDLTGLNKQLTDYSIGW